MHKLLVCASQLIETLQFSFIFSLFIQGRVERTSFFNFLFLIFSFFLILSCFSNLCGLKINQSCLHRSIALVAFTEQRRLSDCIGYQTLMICKAHPTPTLTSDEQRRAEHLIYWFIPVIRALQAYVGWMEPGPVVTFQNISSGLNFILFHTFFPTKYITFNDFYILF